MQQKPQALISSLPVSLFVVGFMSACAVGAGDDLVASQTQELTEEQCAFFAVDGTVTVCHATASRANPYISLQVAAASCVGHSLHEGDYVSVDDPTCDGLGCFPEGAPYDGTVECCEGLAPVDGVCAVSCLPEGAAHDGVSHTVGFVPACCEGLELVDGVCTAYPPCEPCPVGPTLGVCFDLSRPRVGRICADPDPLTDECPADYERCTW